MALMVDGELVSSKKRKTKIKTINKRGSLLNKKVWWIKDLLIFEWKVIKDDLWDNIIIRWICKNIHTPNKEKDYILDYNKVRLSKND